MYVHFDTKRDNFEIHSKNYLKDYEIGVKLMRMILKFGYVMIYRYVITIKEPNFKILNNNLTPNS